MYNNSLKMVTGRQKFKILVVTLRIALINNFFCFVHLQYGKKGSREKMCTTAYVKGFDSFLRESKAR